MRSKKTLPGYDPKNPNGVHQQSKILKSEAIHRAMGNGINFVYDTTTTNWAKLVKMIKDAQSIGYQVELCYVCVSLKTSLYRNAHRERVVPEDLMKEKYALLPITLEVLQGYVDSYIIVNND